MVDVKKNKILFLPAWYPNRTNLSVGSFIRSHAEAINCSVAVDVLHVCGDEKLAQLYHFEKSNVNGIDTYILYFKKPVSKHPIVQFFKACLYVFGQFYGYYQYRKINRRPIFFHVHVLTRAAILPFSLKLFGVNIAYFITEHWSRYLPQDNSYRGFFRKMITKLVVRQSKGITSVSENLKFYMKHHGLNHRNFKVISNVSQDLFFKEKIGQYSTKNHFVHVSNFAANCKNVTGILEAFKLLHNEGLSFSLTMVGDGDEFELAKERAIALGLNEVLFTGFLYGEIVVDRIVEAEALILFSNYETQSVVVTESLSLGVPVVATKVGGVPEMVDESNGILVAPNDVQALAKAIKQIITGEVKFDSELIRSQAAEKFKSDVIAEKFIEFYQDGGIGKF